METNFNFKSHPATSIEQSKRLLALGLNKETADCNYPLSMLDGRPCDCIRVGNPSKQNYNAYPAWSLDRLRELLPPRIDLPTKGHYYRVIYNCSVCYEIGDYYLRKFYGENIYNNIIDCIEWLIKEGYFNKEYLV